MSNIHTLVIPDIHGRRFWKEIVQKYNKEEYTNIVIIFLGDYVDPYKHEGISKEDAIVNFEEIIDYALSDDRVHLLIGNHDMHYFYNAPYKSRCDYDHYNDIKAMFEKNMQLFNIAYEENINGEKFLYTHAGVSSYWMQHLISIGKFGLANKKISKEQIHFCEMLANMTPDADKLNQMLHNFQGQALLWEASYARGGDYQNGSCIWEDWSEWQYEGMEIPGLWQIFGHSRWSKLDPDNADIDYERKLACVDTASGWIITNEKEFIKVNSINRF